MRINGIFRYIMILAAFSMAAAVSAQSVRQERRLITEGNKLYVERKFKDAASKYKEALDVNASSSVAKYNLGMAQIRQVANPKDTTAKNAALLDNGMKMLSEVAKMVKEKPGLASKANYNLGNLEFNRENYSGAINFYKEALRIDPGDNNARKNLRIAQLKQQNQNNQDQNKDQNKDNKDQNKDQNKQDQNKEQDQQKDQDKNKDQDQNKDNDKQNKDINNQTASQILQAIDNKESQTRARVNRANKGDKSSAAGRRVKKW